jgi:serine phosphatase RsbU (regulator of sigma subunit)
VVALVLLGTELALLFRAADAGFACAAPAPTCTVASVAPDGAAARAGLHEGDELLAVDDVPVSDAAGLERLPRRAPGDRVRYLVRGAGGETHEVILTLELAPLGPSLAAPPVQLALDQTARALLALAVVVGVALARPDAAGVRALLAGGVASGLAEVVSPPLFIPLSRQLGIPIEGQANVLGALACCAGLHLSLVLPTRHPLLVWLDGLVPARLRPAIGGPVFLYAATLVLMAAVQSLPVPEGDGYDAYFAASTGVPFVLLLGAALAFARSYRSPASPLDRAQLKWLLLALLVLLAALGLQAVWTALTGREAPGLIHILVLNSSPLIFVALGFAVLRYRLFDVDRLLRLTVTWLLLAGLLLAGFLVLTFLGSRAAVALAGPTAAGDPTTSVLAALVVAAAAAPVHRGLLGALDRLVFRERLGRRLAQDEAGAVLGRAQPAEAVGTFLSQQLVERLGLSRAWVALAPAARIVADQTPRAGSVFSAAPPGVVDWLASATGPLVLAPGSSRDAYHGIPVLRADDPAVVGWYQAGARVLVPLRADPSDASPGVPDEHGLVGVWALGERRSGDLLGREDLEVLQRIGALAAVQLRAQAELQQRGRLEQELRIARLIQHTLLPAEPPRLAGWQLAAHYAAAREVGGDFYDFLALPDGRLGLVVGDVSGKGMPAALVMASTQSILRAVAGSGATPGAALQQANALLRARLPTRMFVTCQYLVLDPRTGRVTYANAGHCPPLWRRGADVVEVSAAGLPLGVLPEGQYAEMELQLGPGEGLLLYSDGVVETHGPNGELFGFERLARLVATAGAGPARLEGLLAGLAAFRQTPGPPEDDLTLLVVERTAP